MSAYFTSYVHASSHPLIFTSFLQPICVRLVTGYAPLGYRRADSSHTGPDGQSNFSQNSGSDSVSGSVLFNMLAR
jgi:hypothetical protein